MMLSTATTTTAAATKTLLLSSPGTVAVAVRRMNSMIRGTLLKFVLPVELVKYLRRQNSINNLSALVEMHATKKPWKKKKHLE